MSREAELYKDKIEVSLDGRQIFYLFFGGAVIVGLVFVLGVMVGRRVEARGHVDRASVAATVDPLAALDRLEGGNGLSFQGALRGGDAPASDVEKTIAAMKNDAKLEKADKKSERHVESAKSEPAKVEPPKVEPPKAEPARVEPPKVDPKKAEKPEKVEPKLDDHKAEAKPDAKVDDKRSAKADGAKADDKKAAARTEDRPETKHEAKTEARTEAKTDDVKKAEKADAAKGAEKAADGEKKPKFTLQLSSFQDKSEAQAYLENIKSAGYAAYIAEAAVDGKQYFRVRTGSYRSMDAANEAKAELERTTKKSAIVTKL